MTKSEMHLHDLAFLGPGLLFLDQYFNSFIDEYLVLWIALVSVCCVCGWKLTSGLKLLWSVELVVVLGGSDRSLCPPRRSFPSLTWCVTLSVFATRSPAICTFSSSKSSLVQFSAQLLTEDASAVTDSSPPR